MKAIAYQLNGKDFNTGNPWVYVLKAGEEMDFAKKRIKEEGGTKITPFDLCPDIRLAPPMPTWEDVNKRLLA